MSHDKEFIVSGEICGDDLSKVREAVCVQVEKVYDSCKEKDCIENAKVIFRNPERIQRLINRAINVKIKKAEIMDVFADVEPVPFKRGFFTVDVKFFIRVELDFFVPRSTGSARVIPRRGVVVFDKKVILFGSEGSIKIFKSHFIEHCSERPIRTALQQDNLPTAKIEVAEPIALNAKIEDILDKFFDERSFHEQLPRDIGESLGDDDSDSDDFLEDEQDIGGTRHEDRIPLRRVVATIGLFSIVKLVRLVQLLIPAFDFCVPNKRCIASTDQNPCELFETIEFPINEFFPPQKFEFPGALEHENRMQEK